jgi:hypothetical protein
VTAAIDNSTHLKNILLYANDVPALSAPELNAAITTILREAAQQTLPCATQRNEMKMDYYQDEQVKHITVRIKDLRQKNIFQHHRPPCHNTQLKNMAQRGEQTPLLPHIPTTEQPRRRTLHRARGAQGRQEDL